MEVTIPQQFTNSGNLYYIPACKATFINTYYEVYVTQKMCFQEAKFMCEKQLIIPLILDFKTLEERTSIPVSTRFYLFF